MNDRPAAPPHVSVVVPVLNGAGSIARCLESLLALDWPADRLEILVVDNGSTDDTCAIVTRFAEKAAAAGERDRSSNENSTGGAQAIVARFPPVRLLHEPRRGAALARNAGWRAARAHLVAFTDSDCQVSPAWLRRLVPAFDDPAVGGAGGRLVPAPPATVFEEYIIAKDILSQERAMRDELLSPPFLVTANAMYRRAALEQVGGFDEWLTVNGEDADLSWRVHWAGWRLDYVAGAEVTHHHRSRLRSFLRQVASYGAGTTYLFAKHRDRFGYRRFTWKPPYYEILRGLALAPVKLATGRTRLERLQPLLDALGGLGFVAGKIRASIRLRVWNV